MSDIIKITNKYAKDCFQCGERVEEGQGFAILDKRLPKDEQGWLTLCSNCENGNNNQNDPF